MKLNSACKSCGLSRVERVEPCHWSEGYVGVSLQERLATMQVMLGSRDVTAGKMGCNSSLINQCMTASILPARRISSQKKSSVQLYVVKQFVRITQGFIKNSKHNFHRALRAVGPNGLLLWYSAIGRK